MASHQESAWGAVEAIEEKVIVETVSKGIVVWKCWSMCWTHLQMFFVSTVVGERSSDVEQPWAAAAKLPGRRPPGRWTRRGPVNKAFMFGELSDYFLCRTMFGHCCLEMLEYVLNTSRNMLCQYCRRRAVLRRGTALRSSCEASWPSPTSTLDKKRTIKQRHHDWWVARL